MHIVFVSGQANSVSGRKCRFDARESGESPELYLQLYSYVFGLLFKATDSLREGKTDLGESEDLPMSYL